jgi:hypothetical protein
MLIGQMYQISGISQMAAQSKNPLGANASGKAIDSMDDLQSERFAHVEADYQQYRVLLGASTIDLAQDIADEVAGKLEPYFDQQEDTLEKKRRLGSKSSSGTRSTSTRARITSCSSR